MLAGHSSVLSGTVGAARKNIADLLGLLDENGEIFILLPSRPPPSSSPPRSTPPTHTAVPSGRSPSRALPTQRCEKETHREIQTQRYDRLVTLQSAEQAVAVQ